MNIQVPIINAFVDGETGGNPAGVVLDAERFSRAEKQKIAARIGLSETAFVSASTVADVKLEFFTPTQQIAHCGHATIATFSFLQQVGHLRKALTSKETIDGRREIVMEEDTAYMEQLAPRYEAISAEMLERVFAALRIKSSDLIDGADPCIVNTGNSFLVIGLTSPDRVKQLKVDRTIVEAISEELNLIGFYVFCTTSVVEGRDAGARMFAPRYGIDEEAATGMAAGPLACYLKDKLGIDKTEFLIEQGHWMPAPSPSLINVRLEVDAHGYVSGLLAGGRAKIGETKVVEI